jgi:hypothetical protein
VDRHLVRQNADVEEEMGTRNNRLLERSGSVAITLHLHFFKIERLVAKSRGGPGERGGNPVSGRRQVGSSAGLAFPRQPPPGGEEAHFVVAQVINADRGHFLSGFVSNDNFAAAQIDEPARRKHLSRAIPPFPRRGILELIGPLLHICLWCRGVRHVVRHDVERNLRQGNTPQRIQE